ncbi:PLP-dependent transferase [Lactifluus volemus]|nr:PLP-dependent transferase [Lactifluus volemus]
MSAGFAAIFGESIRMTRYEPQTCFYSTLNGVVRTTTAQPFLISGSGTLGWDQVSLCQPRRARESVLVLNTGYFGDGFADCLQTYGAQVDQLCADFGRTVDIAQIEQALQSKKYKIVTITHVDTSTGVLSDPKPVAEIVKRVSPDTLVVLDAVCAVAKGLGAPPGLSIVIASQKAMKVFEIRSKPVTAYYASWKKWLSIMKAYEGGSAAYFATPPVNLIHAYHKSLSQITKASLSLDEHEPSIKDAARELGLSQVPVDPEIAANGMTALWCPDGVKSSELLPAFLERSVVVAGGLGTRKDQYFRLGHMGLTAIDQKRGDVDQIIKVLKEVIAEATSKK